MNKAKILIIDDDNNLRRALHIRLKAAGYETAFAVDGLTAMNIALKEAPDLVLLDLGLPAGDGFVVMERFQKHTKLSCIPIIVLTARVARGNQERALAAGACAFFQKPVDHEALLAAIAQALKETGAIMQ
jgi:DNA-binding response OmpR family regulator